MADITITIDDSNDAELDAAFASIYPTVSGTGRQVLEQKVSDYIVDCWNSYQRQQHDLSLSLGTDLTVSGG